MARAASRRQVKPVATTPATNLISKYGRVSKTYPAPVDDASKKVFFIGLPSSLPVAKTEVKPEIKLESSPERALPPQPTATPSKKRKARSNDEDVSLRDARSDVPGCESLKRQRVFKSGKDEPVPIKLEVVPTTATTTTAASTRKSTTSPVADSRRKTRKSDVISQAKTEVRKANQKVKRTKKHNATKSEIKEEVVKKQLPAELLELLDLQRAILKTVSLQLVHQNNNAPLDISSIAPHVARTWGKRRVTVDDIRRCIAIQDTKTPGQEDGSLCSPFIVTDYGRGKLCLEMDLTKNIGRIDENELCQQFEKNLHIMCSQRAMDEMSDLDICFENLSFNDLPKSDITVRHTTMSENPLFAKGQRALTGIKNDILKKQERETQTQASKFPALNPNGTKMTLLDRLRAKEEANANIQLPAGPEMARKRALQRVGDISAVLSMLVSSSNAAGQMVVSFTMPVLQQKLKDSLRVPMSMEEGVDAVRLIAKEVAPEWLKVATVGGKEHVVIQTRRKPYEAELVARVNRLLA
ncbi:hypothetical protein CTAM01_00782 [Colletotrichum tamarilloi]|uniref:DNA replication factor Cdt1 C-terminal domain-containing protein n=1 Tax=Colletotrichum tamarilloi TaxID=1209934 RepID=A0ABQ9RS73_9PEZI|nr:uncharacterized protein CTAM01_00782 [Colletotrichum tamarilloi]KAK1511852.1 hypothetical protein CTAM01_00782 [Colletotrichum tamarilloi]